MGFLGLFKKGSAPEAAGLTRLPSGSFTIDPTGRVVASTLPGSFPSHMVEQISSVVLGMFRSAQQADHPLTQIIAEFDSLKLTAKELRGGAIIFLAPRTPAQ
jgi:hypothetical protein